MAHLQVLQRTDDHPSRPKGTYTADPVEIDEIVQQAWDPIYNGNQTDLQAVVDNFLIKYDDYIYKAPPFQMGEVCWQDVKWACTHHTDTAGGA